MNNMVSIDWFGATVKINRKRPMEALEEVVENILLMKLEQFAPQQYGINRYNSHLACGDIKIYYSLNERTGELSQKMGIFVQMSGQGCRQYEEYMYKNDNNWVKLFQRFKNYHANFTRVDIAHDIFDKSLNISRIYDYCKKGLCISHSKKYQYFETGVLNNGKIVGETINIGVKGGDSQQLGIYNKAMEQKELGNYAGIDDWIRCELRLFGKKANLFSDQIVEHIPLSKIFFSLINQGYRFVLDKKNSSDKNKWRRPTVSWWTDYLKTEDKTVLKVERLKPTLEKSETFLDKQVSKTFAMVYQAKLEAYGQDIANQFVLDLIEQGEKRLTDKDKKLVEQYVQERLGDKYWGE